MKKDYVFDHNFGSYNTDKTINKLLLRNYDDFYKYFISLLPTIFNAKILYSSRNDIFNFEFVFGEDKSYNLTLKY